MAASPGCSYLVGRPCRRPMSRSRAPRGGVLPAEATPWTLQSRGIPCTPLRAGTAGVEQSVCGAEHGCGMAWHGWAGDETAGGKQTCVKHHDVTVQSYVVEPGGVTAAG